MGQISWSLVFESNVYRRDDVILDLVITDEPYMVSEMKDLGLFTGSDHNALSWNLEIRTKQVFATRCVPDYSKADVDSVKLEMKSLDWESILGDLSAVDSWNVFKSKLDDLEHRYIPIKSCSVKSKKPIWMTHAAHKAVQQRRQVYQKYKSTSHPAYVRAARRAKSLVKAARKQFEDRLALNIKEDRKSFYAFVRSKSRSKLSYGMLRDSHGDLIIDPKHRAEMFNDFFSSLFTIKDNTELPVLVVFVKLNWKTLKFQQILYSSS